MLHVMQNNRQKHEFSYLIHSYWGYVVVKWHLRCTGDEGKTVATPCGFSRKSWILYERFRCGSLYASENNIMSMTLLFHHLVTWWEDRRDIVSVNMFLQWKSYQGAILEVLLHYNRLDEVGGRKVWDVVVRWREGNERGRQMGTTRDHKLNLTKLSWQ